VEQSSDDEEVEVIEERVKAPRKNKAVKENAPERPVNMPSEALKPVYVCPSKTSFFNF